MKLVRKRRRALCRGGHVRFGNLLCVGLQSAIVLIIVLAEGDIFSSLVTLLLC